MAVVTIQYYADSDANGNIIGFYNDDINGTNIPTTAIKITEAQWLDCINNSGKNIVDKVTLKLKLTPAPSVPQQLASAITAKVAELDTTSENALKTFTSTALGPVRTYLSDKVEAWPLLTGEYAFVKGNDYDGKPIPWYTVEVGYINHTAAQFVQVYLDARKNVQDTKVKHDTKVKQAKACTAQTQVATITFKNMTPPVIPIGLSGTAGSGQAALSWTANTDVTMLYGGGYNVYKGGIKVNTAGLITSPSYAVTGLSAGTHSFTVSAVDTDGNESAKSAAVSVTVS